MHLSSATIQRFIEDRQWEHCGSYGEPGYSSFRADVDVIAVVLGDYWLKDGKRPLPEKWSIDSYDRRYPRFWAQLEAQGVCFEWHDEWAIDYENDKAYRCEPDSYSWTRSFIYDEYGNMLTPDSDWSEWLAWALNEQTRCLMETMVPDLTHKLTEDGFEQFNGRFESGWYDGQNDTPQEAVRRLHRDHPDTDYVFIIDRVGQFDTHFNLWFKPNEEDE